MPYSGLLNCLLPAYSGSSSCYQKLCLNLGVLRGSIITEIVTVEVNSIMCSNLLLHLSYFKCTLHPNVKIMFTFSSFRNKVW